MNPLDVMLGFALGVIAACVFALWIIRRELTRSAEQESVIEIARYGQATSLPRVAVSICSRLGSQGVYDYPDDAAGNAKVKLYADNLAHITGLPVRDRRKEGK